MNRIFTNGSNSHLPHQDDFIEVLRAAPSLRYLDYSGYTSDMPSEVAAALCGGVQRVRELYLQTTNKVSLALHV